jgi:glutaredoxin
MGKVRLYSMKGCPFCETMKTKFNESNIPYIEIDVEDPKNEKEVNKLMEMTKTDSVPIAIINKKILVPSVSFNTIEEGVNIIKKLL